MVGWILLGKIKKVSSIMVDVWSIWIRRGHFLFFVFGTLFARTCEWGEIPLRTQRG